jgi:hypothetical protein
VGMVGGMRERRSERDVHQNDKQAIYGCWRVGSVYRGVTRSQRLRSSNRGWMMTTCEACISDALSSCGVDKSW